MSVEYSDPYVRRSALRHAPAEGLTAASRWELDRYDEWAENGLAVVRLTGNPDPHVFDGIDPSRLVLSSAELAAKFRRVLMSGAVQWTAVAAPNAGWAEQVFGEPDLERLWEAVGPRCGSTPATPTPWWRSGSATATCSAPAPRR